MPKYRVTVWKSVKEEWEADADSAEEGESLVDEGDENAPIERKSSTLKEYNSAAELITGPLRVRFPGNSVAPSA